MCLWKAWPSQWRWLSNRKLRRNWELQLQGRGIHGRPQRSAAAQVVRQKRIYKAAGIRRPQFLSLEAVLGKLKNRWEARKENEFGQFLSRTKSFCPCPVEHWEAPPELSQGCGLMHMHFCLASAVCSRCFCYINDLLELFWNRWLDWWMSPLVFFPLELGCVVHV